MYKYSNIILLCDMTDYDYYYYYGKRSVTVF